MDEVNKAISCLLERSVTIDDIEANLIKSDCILGINSLQSDSNNRHISSRFIERIFYIIQKILSMKVELNSTLITNIDKILEFAVSLALVPNLIKGIGMSLGYKCSASIICDLELIHEEQKYKNISYLVTEIMKLISIRNEVEAIIIKKYIGHLLAALYQLCYAPILQPNKTKTKSGFVMTEDFYKFMTQNRIRHLDQLNYLLSNVNKIQLYQHLMMLLYRNNNNLPPLFFRQIITKQLGTMLPEEEGFKSLIKSLIPDTNYDPGIHWEKVNMIVKIVKTKQSHINADVYFQNISTQISNMLEACIIADDPVCAITALACLKDFFSNKDLVNYAHDIVEKIIEPITNLLSLGPNQESFPTISIEQSLESLYFCFIHESQVKLDVTLFPSINTILYLYVIWDHNLTIKKKVEELLYNYIAKTKSENICPLFDSFLNVNVENNRINISSNIKKSLKIQSILNTLVALFEDKNNNKLMYQMFIYILHKMTHDRLDLPTKITFSEGLSILSEKSSVQSSLIKHPQDLIFFLKNLIMNTVREKTATREANENIIMCLMLLNTVIPNCDNVILKQLIKEITELKNISLSEEFVILVQELEETIHQHLNYKKGCQNDPVINPEKPLTKCGRALVDLCDPLLPVRAHGLMELGKLLQEEDPETVAKRHYILCVLQENLKHDDSYIYLACIKTLSCMAKICTEEVIETLTQLYVSDAKTYGEDHTKTKLKAGEVLVKIISSIEKKSLCNYKSLLLNAFLEALHDEDFLIRASGFSNLGEFCNALGYDLNPEIILQILRKVEFCIDNEKSPEVRRSSILLCTHLLRGLQNDCATQSNVGLLILKPALLPLLRALQKSYENDEDSTLKLHAQLAIEELNLLIKEYMKQRIANS